ncbi:MAG: ABC transporter ATP-binding protein [Desulfurococcaceae archaeon]
MRSTPLIVKDLVISYGDKIAVNKVSFKVNMGETYCLLGPNGAGKSSTLKAVVGIVDRYEGEVLIYGRSPRDDKHVKNLIGYVPEEPIVPEALTPREIIEFTSSIRGIDKASLNNKLGKLINSFSFEECLETPVFALSRGNKQKLLIMLALLHDPKLLVLDEPFTGLDTFSARVLKEYLKHHVSRNNAVLLSTHIMEIAEKICDRIGIIDRGVLIAEGGINELAEMSKSRGSLEDLFLRLTKRDEWVREIAKVLEE